MNENYKEKILCFVSTSSHAEDERIFTFISEMKSQKALYKQVRGTPDWETAAGEHHEQILSLSIRLI
ncbi:MAG: hypothetical protein LBD55_00680 [Treponema sp.]|jgi:hypothetical protein|nr:hypothetical protein [Treponema sp.]